MCENLNLINDSLSAFEWLVKRKYRITLGHNKKEFVIELVFLRKNFIHISGIDKLADISLCDGNAASALYRSIINSEVLRRRISSSLYFDQIRGRLSHLDMNLYDCYNIRCIYIYYY